MGDEPRVRGHGRNGCEPKTSSRLLPLALSSSYWEFLAASGPEGVRGLPSSLGVGGIFDEDALFGVHVDDGGVPGPFKASLQPPVGPACRAGPSTTKKSTLTNPPPIPRASDKGVQHKEM